VAAAGWCLPVMTPSGLSKSHLVALAAGLTAMVVISAVSISLTGILPGAMLAAFQISFSALTSWGPLAPCGLLLACAVVLVVQKESERVIF
jgi:hypothetical protein